jgi:hypothetical protein
MGTHLSRFARNIQANIGTTSEQKTRFYDVFQLLIGTMRNVPEVLLFSDAEASKNFSQQIIGGKLSSDYRERFLGHAQFFREQFQLRKMRLGRL